MHKLFAICLTAGVLVVTQCVTPCSAQNVAGSSAKTPLDHVIGTVTAVDHTAHTVSVKEDKTGTAYRILLENTKTLLKVEPGAKDLKSATRIVANDLAEGDRVDIRGTKTPDNPNALDAKSVVLMSGRDLQQAHQAETAAWQHSTAGLVASVDPAAQKVTITVRAPGGSKPVVIDASKDTEFLRYAPATPKTPSPSQLADILPGDQLRVIGDKSDDGSTITAQKIYSGPFRTIGGTVASISADGKTIMLKNAGNNQPVEVTLNDDSAVRKLPPEVAMRLAMLLNPSYHPTQGAGAAGGGNRAGGPPPAYGAKSGEAETANNSQGGGQPGASGQPGAGGWQGRPAGGGAGGMRRGGDVSQMIESVPKIAVSDLKTGDAIIVSGAATSADNSHLIATNIIAGVEPILRAAPTRQSGQVMGDWGGLGEISAPQ